MKNSKAAIKKVGRPKSKLKDHSHASSSEKGTAPGYMRKSFVTNIDLSEKFAWIAYWDRKTLKDILFEAMKSYISVWEKKNGPVKRPPKES